MRFFYAKHEQTCRTCHNPISYGDEAVYVKTVVIPQTGKSMPFIVHVQCYIPWVESQFNRWWSNWKHGSIPRPIRHKRGRKRIYKDEEQSLEINRLKALQRYHAKKNKPERILEIQIQINSLLEEELKKGVLPVKFTDRQIKERGESVSVSVIDSA